MNVGKIPGFSKKCRSIVSIYVFVNCARLFETVMLALLEINTRRAPYLCAITTEHPDTNSEFFGPYKRLSRWTASAKLFAECSAA
jgi:hypothetical protein